MADIKELYSYFSHNFRTSVSTIIATIEAVKLDLIDINSDEMNSVYESAYMLDLFDVSFNICINFISGDGVESEKSEIDPTLYVEHVVKEFDSYIKESEMKVSINLATFKTESNEFTVKNLVQLISCEMLRLSPDGIVISSEGKNIIFKPLSSFTEMPDIFKTFKSILKLCDIDMSYTMEEVRFVFL